MTKRVEYIGVYIATVGGWTPEGLNKELKDLNIFPEDVISINLNKNKMVDVWYRKRKIDPCVGCDYITFGDSDLCFNCHGGNKRQVTTPKIKSKGGG